MQFVSDVKKKDFDLFVLSHSNVSFMQSSTWGEFWSKEMNRKPYYVGIVDKKKKLVAAALLFKKELPFGLCYFYSPRGMILDWGNKGLVELFTEEIKRFAKKQKAIYIKIDPEVKLHDLDPDGNVLGGDHSELVTFLKSLGYKHFGFNLMQDTLQPRWMHVIETEGKTIDDIMKDMESKTRQILRKNERSGIHTREISKEELPIFKDIMQHTSDRREFVDRPLSYYENMWDALHDDGILKILVAEINFKEFEQKTKEELETNEKELKDRIYKKQNNILKMNPKKYETHNKQNENEIKRLKSQLEKIF